MWSLLDHGANVNVQDENLWTPLHHASVKGNLKVVELLVERGADIKGGIKDQRTPLVLASGNGNLEVARFLIQCGSDVAPRDGEGRTPVHAAAQEGRLEVVKLLVESGLKIDARDEAPVDLASRNSEHEVSSFLAELMGSVSLDAAYQDRGLGVGRPSLEGENPGRNKDGSDNVDRVTMHTASEREHLDVVRSLLDRGADVN